MLGNLVYPSIDWLIDWLIEIDWLIVGKEAVGMGVGKFVDDTVDK